MNFKFYTFIKISLKFVIKVSIDNTSAFIQCLATNKWQTINLTNDDLFHCHIYLPPHLNQLMEAMSTSH